MLDNDYRYGSLLKNIYDKSSDNISWASSFQIRPGHILNTIKSVQNSGLRNLRINPTVGRNDLIIKAKEVPNKLTTIRNYLAAERFQQNYPKAYKKWADAERMLWASETGHQLTTIGHLCREAMQEFVTVLVQQCQPLDVEDDKALTVKRLKAVLGLKAKQLGKTERPFLDALLVYWENVTNLVQRQEHGAQKEGRSLVWEDGRRVVFQTAIVMFEFDRSLSRAH